MKRIKYKVGDVLKKIYFIREPDDYPYGSDPTEMDEIDKSHIGDHFLILIAHDPAPRGGICWYELMRLRDNAKFRFEWLRIELDKKLRLVDE